MMDTCNFMQQRTAQPPPDSLGINVEKPKFPQYAVCSKRMESFETWPEYIPVGKGELVEAGLVYTGESLMNSNAKLFHLLIETNKRLFVECTGIGFRSKTLSVMIHFKK